MACAGLAGQAWRMMPHDLPPWPTGYQQSQRWLKAGVFDTSVKDLRTVLRLGQGRQAEPSTALFERRPLPSTPASGARVGYDGAKRRRGSKGHMAVDTLGHLVALPVTAANEQDRRPGSALAATGQEVTGDAVERAFVDQEDTGDHAAQDAQVHHRRLGVVKLPEGKKGFVRLPHRWSGERSAAWAARWRRLAHDDERLAETRAGLHCVAFTLLMRKRFVEWIL
jgi:transposase